MSRSSTRARNRAKAAAGATTGAVNDDTGSGDRAVDEDRDAGAAAAPAARASAAPSSRRKAYAGKKESAHTTAFEAWFEEHWSGWLRTVSIMIAIAVIGLLYSTDFLSERFTATLMVVVILGAPLLYTARDLWARVETRGVAWKGTIGAFVAAWAFAAGYPAGCAVLPPHNVDQKEVTAGQTVHLDASKLGDGPIELEVHGGLQGGGETDGKVTLQVVSGGVTETGDVHFSRHSSWMRVGHRGSGQVTTEKLTDKLPLQHARASRDVAVSIAYKDPAVDPTVDILVHPRPYPVRWFIYLGILLVLAGFVLDGRLAGREGSYAAMWAVGTMVFALSLWLYSDPSNVVKPGVGALFTAGFAGLPVGAFLSWLADRTLRPAGAKKRRK